MSIVANGGSTADPTLTVRVGLTGTGAIAADIVQLYRGTTQVGGTIALSAANITAGYIDISTPSLADSAYAFNATITNRGGTSPRSTNYTVTVSAGGGGSTATLLFMDDFDTLEFATPASPNKVWRPNSFWQSLTRGYEDFAGDCYFINPNSPAFAAYSPFSVAGSVLTIKAFLTPAALVSTIRAEMDAQGQTNAVPAWCGGILIQNPAAPLPSQRWKYGFFEWRMRCPIQGKGMFPALWFYATDGNADPLGKGTAELDLLEIFGTPNQWSTTLHPGPQLGTQSQDTAGWHTYAMDWQPTYLRFYRDNVLIYESTGATATYFNTTMGMLMNFSMNAPWFAANVKSDGSSPSPMTMEIDYIKVWDIKP